MSRPSLVSATPAVRKNPVFLSDFQNLRNRADAVFYRNFIPRAIYGQDHLAVFPEIFVAEYGFMIFIRTDVPRQSFRNHTGDIAGKAVVTACRGCVVFPQRSRTLCHIFEILDALADEIFQPTVTANQFQSQKIPDKGVGFIHLRIYAGAIPVRAEISEYGAI